MRPAVVALLLLLCLVGASALRTNKCTFDQRPEHLPRSLNTLSHLGLNNEFHFHGEFYVNFTEGKHNIYFNLTEESAFRVYVAPHASWDIDLYLYNEAEAQPIESSSLLIYTEEVIQQTLPTGSYRLQLNFLLGPHFGDDERKKKDAVAVDGEADEVCETLVVEMAIVPKTRVIERSRLFQCEKNEAFPDMGTIEPNEETGFHFKSDKIYNVNTTLPMHAAPSQNLRLFKAYNFTLPFIKGSNGLWRLNAALGFDFMTGGSIGMMLDLNGTTVETNIDCVNFAWLDVGEPCAVGFADRINENNLRAVLESEVPYTLWLYDYYEERDYALSPCVPFTFSFDLTPIAQPENLLTCEAPTIPATLNTPALLTDRGFLNYREDVFIDLEKPEHIIEFELKEKSNFRVFTEEHRVDIDLRLKNGTNGQNTIASSLLFNKQEMIVMELDAGHYYLSIKYFGVYDAIFCETFLLEIGIAPSRYKPSTCGNGVDLPQKPDLTNLTTLADTTDHSLRIPQKKFKFPLGGDLTQRDIFKQDFTVPVASHLRVMVGVDFIFGDLDIKLSGLNQLTIWGEHKRDMVYLSEDLPPGPYTLTLATSIVQNPPPVLPNFPSCIPYTFQLEIVPESSGASDICWEYFELPFALVNADFQKAPEFHIQGEFLVPRSAQAVYIQSIPFSVEAPSQFRIYCEPHAVDIDFHLEENGRIVASSMTFYDEEEIFYPVVPTNTYKLLVYYYNINSVAGTCVTFNLELAIAPTVAASPCDAQLLPPADFITSPPTPPEGSDVYFKQGSFRFTGNQTSFKHLTEFTLDQDYLMRAIISYDFLFNNLNLRLYSASKGEISHDNRMAMGRTAYNRNDLLAIRLPAGTYTLEIYEPSESNNKRSAARVPGQRCMPFELMVAFAYYKGDPDTIAGNTAYSGCHDFPITPNLNVLSHISKFSGEATHFQRHILPDLKDTLDWVDFHVNVTSVFRVYVAPHDAIDVDVTLYNGTSAHTTGTIKQLLSFTDEESMVYALNPGDYAVKFKYYGMRNSPLPPASACAHYDAELAVVPLATLQGIASLVDTTCTVNLPPRRMEINKRFVGQFQFKQVHDFEHLMVFNLTEPAELLLSLRYDFASSGLALELSGAIKEDQATVVNRNYYGKTGTNHAYLYKVLPAGDYTLSVHTPADQILSQLPCGQFELHYVINTTNVPDDGGCDDAEQLPTDLTTASGGSRPYGGPQDADGSIRLYGSHFIAPERSFVHSYIPFKVPADSFFRMWVRAQGENDIDFYIYNNVNRTLGSLVKIANGVEEIESAIWRLPAQTDLYLLDVSFFHVDASIDCNTFELELAMKPASTVFSELSCPIALPLGLPRTLVFSANNDVDIHGEYVFTKDSIDANKQGDQFRYKIRLEPRDNTLVYADIGFDFLANDFRLSIEDGQGNTVARGTSAGEENRSSYINFHSTIRHLLAVGKEYYLVIHEDLESKELPLNASMCHRFAFSLFGYSERTPHVLAVSPEGGDDLDPLRDLLITVTFSEPVAFPARSNVQNHVLSNGLAYLRVFDNGRPTDDKSARRADEEAGDEQHVPPNRVGFVGGASATTLQLEWDSEALEPGQAYELDFNFTSFATADGKHFENAVQSDHIYLMSDYQCNGHGTWVHDDDTDDEIHCTCDPPYTGPHCTSCLPGYHGAGTECVADVPCAASTCNGHGTCRTSNGVPYCRCYEGFATVGDRFCSICAEGYQGFPDCRPIPSPFEESTRCKAPLLPRSLDSIAYLGFDKETRLQGYYFIDPERREHDIGFTLKEKSALRIYLEPHWVDVDIWLYLRTSTGLQFVKHGGLAISTEESLFEILDANVGDDGYLIKLRYYLFTTSDPECETINLDLSIVPVAVATQRLMAHDAECKQLLPQGGPMSDVQMQGGDPPVLNIDREFSYNPARKFAVSNATATNDGDNNNNKNFFWNVTFVVADPPAGKQLLLHSEVGYQFLEGDLALLLESGNGADHCQADARSGCITGFNLYNKNVLNTVISPGTYTLWIYQPEDPLTTCSMYEFSFAVRYADEPDDTFACRGARFPLSLNEPNYLDERGAIHLQDRFLLSSNTNAGTNFTLETPSYFKVSVSADLLLGFFVTLYKQDAPNMWVLVERSEDGLIFRKLPPATYKLSAHVYDTLPGVECPELDIELAIAPASTVDLDPETCPGVAVDRAPQLPADLGSAPYTYAGGAEALVTHRTGEIASYPIVVSGASLRLRVEAASDFLLGDVRVRLELNDEEERRRRDDARRTNQQARFKYGEPLYNLNVLEFLLTEGSYTLSLQRAAPTQAALPLPPCAPYEFSLSLSPVFQSPCLGMEALPKSLSGLRFLGSSRSTYYQSDSWAVPNGRFVSHRVRVQVEEASLLRVYTEPHYIDIDLKLWQVAADNTETLAASADNGFFGEEVIVYEVDVGQTFSLEILFWKWDTSVIPSCPTFSLGFAVTPLAFVDASPCNGALPEHWPPEFPRDMPTKPYYYDSTSVAGGQGQEYLYLQQVVDKPKSKTYAFHLNDITDLHAEIGYDFATGDLVLKLANKQTSDSYYGENERNRNVLSLMNLIPGPYELTIYEPVENNPAQLKCVNFTFLAIVSPGGEGQMIDPQRPPFADVTFDSLPYLYTSGAMHLQGDYLMFAPGHETKTVNFTVKEPSYVRVSAHIPADDNADIPPGVGSSVALKIKQVNDVAPLATGLNRAAVVLSRANTAYEVIMQFSRPAPGGHKKELSAADAADIEVDLELAIAPLSAIDAAIAAFPRDRSNCKPLESVLTNTTLRTDPNGYFSFHASDVTVDAQRVRQSKFLLGNYTVELTRDSIVYVMLGYNFLYEAMYVHLERLGAAVGEFPEEGMRGRDERNHNVINNFVPAGTYALSISMTRQNELWKDAGDLCLPYTLSVLIQNATTHEHADCTDFFTLPWDLDSAHGGSAPYGGPMSNGRVHISGDRFLVNRENAVSKMTFTVREKSMLSIFTTQETSQTAITYRVYNKGTNGQTTTLIQPVHSNHTRTQRVETFVLDYINAPTIFEVQLIQNLNDYFLTGNCPYFALDLMVDTFSRVTDAVTCPTSRSGVLPANLTLDARGVAVSNVQSVFTSKDLQQYTQADNGWFAYPVQFEVKQPSTVEASIAFNSLASFFFVGLRNSHRIYIGRSSYYPDTQASGTTNLVRHHSAYIRPDNYTLDILQPRLNFLPTPRDGYQLCLPFTWDVHIIPTGIPYVTSIVPAGGAEFNPTKDLVIEISLSEIAFSATNETVNRANPLPIKNAFYLRNGGSKISPAHASARSADSTAWSIVFLSASLREGETYSLNLTEGVLFAQDRKEFLLPGVHNYTMMKRACSGHGMYDDQSGTCLCQSGYAGLDCDRCDVGFYDPKPNDGVLKCVKQNGTTLCKPGACGCMNPEDPIEQCIPLGVCKETADSYTCTCNKSYDGPHCEKCAEDYIDYPTCRKEDECMPACSEHGVCDSTNNKCICAPGWKGSPTCDKCTPGFTGPDCKTYVGEGGHSWQSFLKFVKVLGIIVGCVLGVGAIGWFVWWRYKIYRGKQPKRNYFPLGLQELEDASELQPPSSASAFGSVDDDDYGNDFGAGGADKGANDDENDFDPRAGGSSASAGDTKSGGNLLDL